VRDDQQPSSVNTTREGSTTIPQGSRGQVASKQETLVRVCRVCMTAKSLDQFYFHHGKYLQRICKSCTIICQREKQTGLSESEYQRLFALQKGVCAICKRVQNSSRYTRLAGDHCHKTGKLRGLLCFNCNTGIGLFKDDPERLLSAVSYLGKI